MPLNHSNQFSQLTDGHFQAIGKVMVEWSNVEYLLGFMLCRLTFTPDFLGRCYSDQLSASKIQDTILDALEIHEHMYNCQIIDLKKNCRDTQHK